MQHAFLKLTRTKTEIFFHLLCQEIKRFTSATSVANPRWFFIKYCHVGGIEKFFRSADLIHFIKYVQLFYNNMPIDWLLESYLADRVCTIEKTSVSIIYFKSLFVFININYFKNCLDKLSKYYVPRLKLFYL